MRYFAKRKTRNRYSKGTWYSHWPGGDASALAAQFCQIDGAGWPIPPRFSSHRAERRATRWYRTMRGGGWSRVERELAPFGHMGWEWKDWRRHRNARMLAELAAYGYALRWAAKAKAEGDGTSWAVSLAAQPNYLGDVAFVRSLVERFIRVSIAHPDVLNDPNWEELAEEEMRIGRIFAGLETGYTPIGSWNTPEGGLGAAIEAAFGVDLDALAGDADEYDPFAYGITEALCEVRDAAQRFAADADALMAIAGYTTAVLVGLAAEESFADVLRTLEASVYTDRHKG